MTEYFSNSEKETEEIGARFAEKLPGGSVVAMYGDLGAGKTAFVRGMARGMGLDAHVSSPTFTIVNGYCPITRTYKKFFLQKKCHFATSPVFMGAEAVALWWH